MFLKLNESLNAIKHINVVLNNRGYLFS